jgi:hypothetical protein
MNGESHQRPTEGDVLPRVQNPSLRRNLPSLLTACLVFSLLVLNIRYPVLRFTIHALNTTTYVVGAFLPAFVAVWTLRLSSACTRRWIRAAIQLLLALLVILSVLFGILALMAGAWGPLVRTRLLAHGYALTAYYDGDGIEVYQERVLLPGIALVRRLDYVENADQARVESVDKDHARITLVVYEEQTSKTHEDIRVYELKPFVYF